jgi:hypothetical protein
LKVRGLAHYGLTVAGLAKLGRRSVRITVQLKGQALSRLVTLTPAKRNAQLRRALKHQFATLSRAFPDAALASRDELKGSWTLDGQLAAARIRALASRPEVAHVSVERIEGRAKRPQRKQLAWFSVWGVVVIQIEGHRKGSVELEDRLMLVKGYDAADAVRRLDAVWARYATPYMNPAGHLVRWKLVSVRDVYEVPDYQLSPAGTEVYSRLRTSPMKSEYRWRLDRSAPKKALQPASRAERSVSTRRGSRASRG